MQKNKIDENRQSRSIATFGLENLKKFSNLNVFIYGINGISLEAAKNLILTGIKSLTIFDDEISKSEDLSWNFFLNEKDIEIKRRDETVLLKLKELNNYTEVRIENDPQIAINRNDIIVLTKIKKSDEIHKINQFCRVNQKGFIYANLFGLAGYIFSDFGKHIILDEDGEENQKAFISSITQNLTENKIEFSVEIDEKEGIDNGKYVRFKEIEGMEQLNYLEPTKIFKINEHEYFINYNIKLDNYIKGGIIEEVKIPQKMQYLSYKEYMENPKDIDDLDGNKKNRNCLLHCYILAIQKYFDKYQKLPNINDETQADEIVKLSKEFYISFKNNGNDLFKKSKYFDNNFIKDLILISLVQLPTDSSFLGGILAQEILKFIGLYKPLNQILYYNNYTIIENLVKKNFEINSIKKDRYYYEKIILGLDLVEKLKALNIFIIGAGALGCEIMKILSLMGVSTAENANIILTDNDSIEISNLNRQFFFNTKHVGKNKALVCCEEIKKINPNINCIPLDKLVNHESEDIFSDSFWSNINIVILAVDNVSARRYIDQKCTAYNIKLIEIGTQGVNASSSLIIPNMTSCYNDLKQSPKKEIPQCTLKFYPLTNIHCIEYAKQKFNDFFIYNIKDALECVKSKVIPLSEVNKEYLNKLENIQNIFKIFKNKNFESCLDLAINEFYRYFNYNIRDLLNDFPKDLKKKDGTLFWNGDKRMPKEIDFNINDETHFDFIYYYSYLIAKNLKIDIKDKEFSKNYISKNFVENKKILNVDEMKLRIKLLIEENREKINLLDIDQWNNIEFDEFEKDNDNNHHIDFLTSFSNLRAKNYRIEKCDKNLVKFISGNIIPAIPTTTVAICGYVISQIYILIRDNFCRDDLRTLNFCLSTPNFNIKKPSKPLIIRNKKDKNSKTETKVPYDFTVWDKIEIEGNINVNKLKDLLSKMCGFEFDFDGLYTIDDYPLINNDDDMEKLIEDLYFSVVPFPIEFKENMLLHKMKINNNKEENNFKDIYLKYYGQIDETISVIFPIIKYHYRQK